MGISDADRLRDPRLDLVLADVLCEAPTHGDGLANHVPMTATALAALGLAHQLAHYSDHARRHQSPDAIEHGTHTRIDMIEAALEADGPDVVVARTLDDSADRVFHNAFHGSIRVAYALRAVDAMDTGIRRTELARALAVLAGDSPETPTRRDTTARTGSPGGVTGLEHALALPDALGVRGFMPPTERLINMAAARAARAGLPATLLTLPQDLLDRPPTEALAELAGTAGQWYVAHGHHAPFAFLHLITGPAALAELVGRLQHRIDERTGERILHAAWHAAVTVHAAYLPEARTARLPHCARTVDEIVRTWHPTQDEHVIKLADTITGSEAGVHLERFADELLAVAAADLEP